MRVAVIGVCGFGQHHARAFQELGCDLVGVVDVNPDVQKWAEALGAAAYTDYRELFSLQLDAVSLALPPRLHPEVIREFVRRGIAVFCEKPVAPTASEAQRLLDDLGADAPVMVGFCFRYNAVYRRLKELMHDGTIGRVRSILARKCWATRTPWRLQEGGGVVFVKDIHYYDLIPWLLEEEPSQLLAVGGSFFHAGPAEDSYHLLMGFPSGAVFNLDSAWWTLPKGVGSFEVVGDKARVVVSEDRMQIIADKTSEEIPAGEPMVMAEIRHFVEWRTAGGPPPPGLREALQANRLAQRVYDLIHS
ncbi:MAG: Gfo/Idh/MocA family protein [Limnochordia bacterium]|jgi:UDP-N-acetylglucosamine 3-dehydrogenase